MNKLTACILCLCLLASKTTWSQHPDPDSFQTRLNKAAEDTNKVHLYWKAGAAAIYQEPLEALPYFKGGLLLAKKLQFNPGIEKCFAGISLSFSFISKYDSTLLYIDSAIYYARKVGNPARLALVYLNRADVYTNLQNISAALKNCDTALKYAEQINNKNGLGRIYSIMCDIYLSQKQYTEALSYLEKSQAYFEEVHNMQMVGMSLYGHGEILQDMKQLDKAIPYFKQAIHIADSVQDVQNLSSSYCALSQIYVDQEKYTEGEAMARKALLYAQESGNRKQEGVIYDVFYHIYAAQKDYKRAVAEELKAYTIIKEEKDLLREYTTAYSLAEAYSLAGNTSKAYEYMKISSTLNDSLLKQKYNDTTASLLAGFHVSQKDKEIALLNKDKELQKQNLKEQWLLTIGAFALAALALLGIWLAINRNRLRQRMKELELRNHIAADLHDEVGSSLSSIHMLSQVAAQQSPQDTSHVDILNRVSTNARETMEKMGDIVWMIKPGENESQSLWQRMERFMFEMCGSQNISCATEGKEVLENVKLTMQQRKNFYLVFKEALNNAVKYSGTDKVDVRISQQNHQLQLCVQDYGKGFSLNGEGGHTGNGLSNMRNRAKELGGQLSIDAAAGKGTGVLLSFPV
jgi:two-component system sensor histidine kinase UhpB